MEFVNLGPLKRGLIARFMVEAETYLKSEDGKDEYPEGLSILSYEKGSEFSYRLDISPYVPSGVQRMGGLGENRFLNLEHAKNTGTEIYNFIMGK